MDEYYDQEGCLYKFDGDSVLEVNIPFPSIEEMREYGITEIKYMPYGYDPPSLYEGPTKIDEYIINRLRDYFEKELIGEPKTQRQNYIRCLNSNYPKHRDDITNNILEWYINVPNARPQIPIDLIELYIKEQYPVTYEEISRSVIQIYEVNILDDSTWTIESKYIGGYEYYCFKFKLFYGAKLVASKRHIYFDFGNPHFWYDCLFSYCVLDEYFKNEIPFFSLRSNSYKKNGR